MEYYLNIALDSKGKPEVQDSYTYITNAQDAAERFADSIYSAAESNRFHPTYLHTVHFDNGNIKILDLSASITFALMELHKEEV